MAALIGALRVSLSADTAAFSRGMSKAEAQAKSSANAIERSLGGIKAAVGAFAAGLGADAVVGVIKRALDYASSLGEVAQQLGVTTKELQVYRYAASQVGVEQDAMDKGLQRLTRTIGMATTGGKAQKQVFDQLGISLRDANGHVRTAGDVLPEIADALNRIPDPARRAAVETSLFGKAGQQLDTLLAGGSSAMRELANAAEELGIVLSDEQIQHADDTADKLAAVKQVLEAKIAGVVADNSTAILDLANSLATLADKAIKALGAWLAFRKGVNVQQEQHARADAYIDSRPNLSVAEKSFAKQRARAIIDQRLGITSESAGGILGFLGLRRSSYPVAAQPKGAPKPAAAKAATAPLDDIQLSGGGGGGGGRKRSGPSAASLAARAEAQRKDALRDQHQYDQELARYSQDELRAREDLAGSMAERSELQRQQLEAEFEGEKKQILFQQQMGDITAAQAEELIRRKGIVHTLELQKVDLDANQARLQQQYDAIDQMASLTEERLQIEGSLARTAKQRREIEMRILDNTLKEERAQIARILNDPMKIDQWDQARARGAALDANEPLLRQQVNERNRAPLESYLSTLPRTAAEANEALENVAAGGIQSIVDGLADAATGARSLGDIFSNVAKQIIADLIRIQIQKAIVGGLGSLLGLGGPKLSGIDTAGITNMANTIRVPGLATGGSFMVGARPGVDTNLLSINGQPRARVSANERIAVIPNNAGGGRTEVVIHPTPYFDAHVDGRADVRVGHAAPRIAAAGSNGAQVAMAVKASRRFP